MEDKIKKIKKEADCVIYAMKNHKLVEDINNTSFDDAIYKMHNAASKKDLADAYAEYFKIAICNHYHDACIIAGIMQNEEANKKYSIDIYKVITELIKFRNTIEKPIDITDEKDKPAKDIEPKNTGKDLLFGMSEESINKLAAEYDPSAEVNAMGSTSADIAIGDLLGARQAKRKAAYEWVHKNDDPGENNGSQLSDKLRNKIRNKHGFIKNIANRIIAGECDNPLEEINKAYKEGESLIKILKSIKTYNLSEEDLTELNDIMATLTNITENLDKIKASIDNKPKNKIAEANCETPVQQTLAAHAMEGFNISNFIKDKPDNKMQPVSTVNNHQHKTVFPHETCGLTDEQITNEVKSHFELTEYLPAYALYDLVKNKLLSKKMNELGSKQKPNNLLLTQVDIKDYIDIPDLLNKFNVCFTTPCKDKSYIIVVLFNTTPVPDTCGCINYPIHIFKAKLSNN